MARMTKAQMDEIAARIGKILKKKAKDVIRIAEDKSKSLIASPEKSFRLTPGSCTHTSLLEYTIKESPGWRNNECVTIATPRFIHSDKGLPPMLEGGPLSHRILQAATVADIKWLGKASIVRPKDYGTKQDALFSRLKKQCVTQGELNSIASLRKLQDDTDKQVKALFEEAIELRSNLILAGSGLDVARLLSDYEKGSLKMDDLF